MVERKVFKRLVKEAFAGDRLSLEVVERNQDTVLVNLHDYSLQNKNILENIELY